LRLAEYIVAICIGTHTSAKNSDGMKNAAKIKEAKELI
jgi:hypothetical protein